MLAAGVGGGAFFGVFFRWDGVVAVEEVDVSQYPIVTVLVSQGDLPIYKSRGR